MSAAIPAQSPTLSPTRSAITAALRGIIFGDILLDLADQVRADIGGLGVDAAADAHEQRQQRAAEAEAEQGIRRGSAEDDEDHRAAEQAEAVGEHAGDRAGVVGDGKRFIEPAPGSGSDADIGLDGHAHAPLPDDQREGRAQDEGNRAPDGDDQDDALLAQGLQTPTCASALGGTTYTLKNITTVRTPISGRMVLSCRPR